MSTTTNPIQAAAEANGLDCFVEYTGGGLYYLQVALYPNRDDYYVWIEWDDDDADNPYGGCPLKGGELMSINDGARLYGCAYHYDKVRDEGTEGADFGIHSYQGDAATTLGDIIASAKAALTMDGVRLPDEPRRIDPVDFFAEVRYYLTELAPGWTCGDWYPTGLIFAQELHGTTIVLDYDGPEYRVGLYTDVDMTNMLAWVVVDRSAGVDPVVMASALTAFTYVPTAIGAIAAFNLHLPREAAVTADPEDGGVTPRSQAEGEPTSFVEGQRTITVEGRRWARRHYDGV